MPKPVHTPVELTDHTKRRLEQQKKGGAVAQIRSTRQNRDSQARAIIQQMNATRGKK